MRFLFEFAGLTVQFTCSRQKGGAVVYSVREQASIVLTTSSQGGSVKINVDSRGPILQDTPKSTTKPKSLRLWKKAKKRMNKGFDLWELPASLINELSQQAQRGPIPDRYPPSGTEKVQELSQDSELLRAELESPKGSNYPGIHPIPQPSKERPQNAEGYMAYTINQSEDGYAASIDQPFDNANEWWQSALVAQQSHTGFAGAVTSQYDSNTRFCDNPAFDNFGVFPTPIPCDMRPFPPNIPRRHTVASPRTIGWYGYDTQHETCAPASFPPFTPAHTEFHTNQYVPSNFKSGIMSPSATIPSSRPSITSFNSNSPTASSRLVDQNMSNTRVSPQPDPLCLGGSYPYSPTVSDRSPTQSQLTQPLRIGKAEDYVPELEPIVNTEFLTDTIFCWVPGCNPKFTGEYRKGNLQRHLKSNHPELLLGMGKSPGDPEKLRCSMCPQVFKRSDARKKHEHRKHHIGPKPPTRFRYTAS